MFKISEREIDMNKLLSICTVLTLCVVATPVFAKDNVQTDEMKQQGFGDVAKVYSKMDSKQKKDVRKQASSIERKLKKMSEQDRQKLEMQLKTMAKSLGVKDFDVSSINTKKKVSIKGTKKDFTKYKKRMNKSDGIKAFDSKR
jgi:hypothetical protein